MSSARLQRFYFFLCISLSIIASLCLVLWLITKSASRVAIAPMPELEGEEAVSYLKDRGLYDSLQSAIDSLRYKIEPGDEATADAGAAYRAANPRQGYRAVFTGEQVALISDNNEGGRWRVDVSLTGYGYGERLMKVVAGPMTIDGNRIEIEKTGVRGQGAEL